ncbi:MAG: hypothetical protein K0R15_1037 [Clostridiales bacterium]|jgi:hypothetical protein|nr:hypothetical protein [Clostridiales bacterium]
MKQINKILVIIMLFVLIFNSFQVTAMANENEIHNGNQDVVVDIFASNVNGLDNTDDLDNVDDFDDVNDLDDLNDEVDNYELGISRAFDFKLAQFNIVIAFVDANKNGVFDKGEETVSGVNVNLKNAHDPLGIGVQGYTNYYGVAFMFIPIFYNWIWDYYISISGLTDDYSISTVNNTLFGLDGNSSYQDITLSGNKIVGFGGKSTVYVPLVKKVKTTLKITNEFVKKNKDKAVKKGVTYELYQLGVDGFKLVDTQTSDKDGNCYFKYLDPDAVVYIRAVNLDELKLVPQSGLGGDGFSGYINIITGENIFQVTMN